MSYRSLSFFTLFLVASMPVQCDAPLSEMKISTIDLERLYKAQVHECLKNDACKDLYKKALCAMPDSSLDQEIAVKKDVEQIEKEVQDLSIKDIRPVPKKHLAYFHKIAQEVGLEYAPSVYVTGDNVQDVLLAGQSHILVPQRLIDILDGDDQSFQDRVRFLCLHEMSHLLRRDHQRRNVLSDYRLKVYDNLKHDFDLWVDAVAAQGGDQDLSEADMTAAVDAYDQIVKQYSQIDFIKKNIDSESFFSFLEDVKQELLAAKAIADPETIKFTLQLKLKLFDVFNVVAFRYDSERFADKNAVDLIGCHQCLKNAAEYQIDKSELLGYFTRSVMLKKAKKMEKEGVVCSKHAQQ